MYRAVVALTTLLLAACRNETVTTNGSQGTGVDEPADSVAFVVAGIMNGSRSYARVKVQYDLLTDTTTLETFDDSTSMGKFKMSFKGGMVGTYRHTVTGGNDTNQVSMWFAPLYSSGMPTGVFELTAEPEDSLEAAVSVTYYGEVGDTVSGTMTGVLRLAGVLPPSKAVLHSGRFRVKRVP